VTAYSRPKTYVALYRGVPALWVASRALHHISAQNTYPRTCCIKHVLGFTHFCGQPHSDGAFLVWRITAKKRMVAKLKAIKPELQRRKHQRTAEVGARLRQAVLGYYQYHAVLGNMPQLHIFT
jgi:hypothetical protein